MVCTQFTATVGSRKDGRRMCCERGGTPKTSISRMPIYSDEHLTAIPGPLDLVSVRKRLGDCWPAGLEACLLKLSAQSYPCRFGAAYAAGRQADARLHSALPTPASTTNFIIDDSIFSPRTGERIVNPAVQASSSSLSSV